MQRRDFLKKTSIGLAALLSPKIAFSSERVVAGNLSIYPLSKFIESVNEENISAALNKSVETFENAEIYFKNFGVVRSPPKINNPLDMCVIMFDSLWQLELPPEQRFYGLYGVEEVQYYRRWSGLKYEDKVIKENCAFIFPNLIKSSTEEEINLVDKLASAICHEVGHFLDLGHIYDNVGFEHVESKEYIMAKSGYGSKFHEKEIDIMRGFITNTRNGKTVSRRRTALTLNGELCY